MSLALTLLQRDLVHWPRRRWFYLKRLVFVGLCALIVLWAFGIAAISGSTTMGLKLFHSLSATVLFCTCVFSGTTSGLNLMREKRERTLGLLFMSDISIPEQVVGKTLTGAFVIVTTLLSTFPMFVLCATLGGVSPAQIAAAFAILLGTVTVGSCAGISAAASASTERALVGRVLVLVALVFAALPMAVFLAGGRNTAIVSLVLPVVSPFVALNLVGDGASLASGYWNCGFNLLLGLPFLFAAMRALPREFDPKPNPLLAWLRRSRTRAGQQLNRASVVFTAQNPVLTKDVHCVYSGYRREWVIASGIALIIIAVASVTASWVNVTSLTEALAAAGIGAAVLCAFTSGIFAIIRSARSFNLEKQDRTLELLVMSDLTDRQIIWGKLGAVAVSVLPWLVIGGVGGALFMAESGEWMMVLVGLGVAVNHVTSIAAFSLLAMLLSLRMKTTTVLAITFVAYIIWTTFIKYMMTVVLALVPVLLASLVSNVIDIDGEGWFLVGWGGLIAIGNIALDVVMILAVFAILKRNFRNLSVAPS